MNSIIEQVQKLIPHKDQTTNANTNTDDQVKAQSSSTSTESSDDKVTISDYIAIGIRLSLLPLSVAWGLLKNSLAGNKRRPLKDTLINRTLRFVFKHLSSKQVKALVRDRSLERKLNSVSVKLLLCSRNLNGFNKDFSGNGFTARWISEISDRTINDPVILYMHGGGYNMHMDLSQVRYICKLARFLKPQRVSIIALDYDTAPETKNPVQRNQAVACLKQVLRTSSKPILLGDSSGGNLALTTLLETDEIPPKSVFGIALVSPATDPKAETGSMNSTTDILTKKTIDNWMANWLGDNSNDPKSNPLYYDPMIWLEVMPDNVCMVWGEDDCLRDQCVEFKTLARVKDYFVEKNGTHDCILRGIHSEGSKFISNELASWCYGHGASY